MLPFLSLLGMAAAFSTGLLFPKKAGWSIVFITPILGPAGFTLVSSPLLPLTMHRIAFAVTVGVVMSNYNRDFPLRSILRSRFIKIVLVFSLFVILISLEDRFENIIFTYIPNLIFAFVLCFILIRNEKDLHRLVNIFVWQAALIGLFITLQYYIDFDINIILMKTIPGYDFSGYQSQHFISPERVIRSGTIRAIGIDGNAVQTGYRLSFLFPLVLWYTFREKKRFIKPWRILPLLFIIISFGLLKTRAAYVGILFSLLALATGLIFFKRTKITTKIKKLFSLSITFFIIISLIIAYNPSIVKIARTMIVKSFSGGPTSKNEMSVEMKLERIPVAIDHFKKRPFLGYGSPQIAYSEVMHGEDVASPIIYLLSGGIFLCLIYLLMLFYMPYSITRLSRRKWLYPAQREFLAYASAAFVGGIAVVFSNWQEAHFLVMYMLYISIYKVYQHKWKSR